jgi:hypothetical protein
LIKLFPIEGNDPEAIQRPGSRGMDDLDPFHTAEPRQVRRDRPEVPPPEPREIRAGRAILAAAPFRWHRAACPGSQHRRSCHRRRLTGVSALAALFLGILLVG